MLSSDSFKNLNLITFDILFVLTIQSGYHWIKTTLLYSSQIPCHNSQCTTIIPISGFVFIDNDIRLRGISISRTVTLTF